MKQIVPANPIAAAAEGAMLPIVIFAVVFGFAATRIPSGARKQICGLFDAIVQVMLVIVHWVLLLAPIGVFALALLVTARAGASVVSGLAHYVIVISILCTLTIVAMYAVIAWFSRIPVITFTKAAWPAQAIAFSTQSSLASLPAMVEKSRTILRVPTHVSDLVLPLAVSLFRITSPAANLGVALYLAHMNGIHPSVFQIGLVWSLPRWSASRRWACRARCRSSRLSLRSASSSARRWSHLRCCSQLKPSQTSSGQSATSPPTSPRPHWSARLRPTRKRQMRVRREMMTRR